MEYINNTSKTPCTRRAKSESPENIYRYMVPKHRHHPILSMLFSYYHHSQKKSFKYRFNRRDYTCGSLKNGKKVNWKRGQDKVQQYQTTTKRQKFVVPWRQASYYPIKYRFPKTQFSIIPTNRKSQIYKRNRLPSTIHNQRRLRQPRIL